MDVTAGMIASNALRSRIFPAPSECEASGHCFSEESIQIGRQNYAAKIERLDFWLGRYLEIFRLQNVQDSTITCIAVIGSLAREHRPAWRAPPRTCRHRGAPRSPVRLLECASHTALRRVGGRGGLAIRQGEERLMMMIAEEGRRQRCHSRGQRQANGRAAGVHRTVRG